MALQKYAAGSPFKLSSRAWNAFVDAANDYKATGTTAPIPNYGIGVIVRNSTTFDLMPGNIVRLGNPVVTPPDNEDQFVSQIWFTALRLNLTITTNWADASNIGLVTEYIPKNQHGNAIIAGVAIARVDILDESHRFAQGYKLDGTPIFRRLVLHSHPMGPVEILYQDRTGTGVKLCLVKLGNDASRLVRAAVVEELEGYLIVQPVGSTTTLAAAKPPTFSGFIDKKNDGGWKKITPGYCPGDIIYIKQSINATHARLQEDQSSSSVEDLFTVEVVKWIDANIDARILKDYSSSPASDCPEE